MRCSADDEAHRTADLAEMRREALALSCLSHGEVGPEGAVQIVRGAGRVAVHHIVTHPRRVSRRGDQIVPDLLAHESHPAKYVDPGREPDGPAKATRRGGFRRAAVERHDPGDQV